MLRKICIFFLIFLPFLSACDLKDNVSEPTLSFVKIYDNNDFSKAFTPLDIKQTADSGFVILGRTPSDKSSFYSVYLMKVARDGAFQWEHTSDIYVNPISDLLVDGNDFVFFATNRTTLTANLLRAEQTPGTVFEVPTTVRIQDDEVEYKYPLAAGAITGGYLLQTLDENFSTTRLFKLSANGSANWSTGFDIFESLEEKTINHLTRRGQIFPFFVGETGNSGYFFNGFNNFTLSMTFVDANGKQTAELKGEEYQSGVSNALAIAGGKMAMARYKGDGENVLLPQATVNPAQDGTAQKLVGNDLPELNKFARIIIKKATIAGKNVVLYGTDTKNGQMVIFAYDEATGNLLGSRYIGSNNTFQMGGFTLTQDEGMAISGAIFVAGRFSRICLFKLTKSDLEKLVGI
ncbi:MAG: hypothetical protein H7Y04_07970 [Verrucomicrobia bacterium]|nr:hypothetical protein [Cytophagales bacterium]